jgi:hypothetical protein
VVFEVPDVIVLNTRRGLHGTPFDWRHYGGPLALFRLCQFVRTEILRDVTTPRTAVPVPQNVIYQVGDLILTKVDQVPARAVRVSAEKLPNDGISLPEGYVIRPVARRD